MKSIAILLLGMASLPAFCQADEEPPLKSTHRITIGLGHAHVSGAEKDGKTAWVVLPAWSINYDYWLTSKWAIGLQSDVILESYVVKTSDDTELERDYPVALVPSALFKPGKYFTFILGVGAELADDENLALTRIGAEFGYPLGKNWEAGVAAEWDNKWGYYDSWAFVFTFSRKIRKE